MGFSGIHQRRVNVVCNRRHSRMKTFSWWTELAWQGPGTMPTGQTPLQLRIEREDFHLIYFQDPFLVQLCFQKQQQQTLHYCKPLERNKYIKAESTIRSSFTHPRVVSNLYDNVFTRFSWSGPKNLYKWNIYVITCSDSFYDVYLLSEHPKQCSLLG